VDDSTLTLVAMIVELGCPVAFATLYWYRPAMRRRVAVLLGTVTPAILAYAWGAVGYIADPGDMSNRWGFGAMWGMSLAVYVAAVLVGVGLSFVPRPSHLLGRYFVGFLAPPIGFGLLIFGADLVSAA
jgi:hypothetical protein